MQRRILSNFLQNQKVLKRLKRLKAEGRREQSVSLNCIHNNLEQHLTPRMHSKEAPASASKNCMFGGIASISLKLRLSLTNARPAKENCMKPKLREQLGKNSSLGGEAKPGRKLFSVDFGPKPLKVRGPSFNNGEQAGPVYVNWPKE